jgi:hypothetical protein
MGGGKRWQAFMRAWHRWRRDDVGMIRIDFPGFSGEDPLEEISWDEWF